jgi:hypothetical protein|tara:strand:+ start:3022 stop:4560 length:1539 start_codon:yes stop_codon:yes gene_type:complete
MSDAKRFAAIFEGLELAYGTYRIDRKQNNGKNTGKATVVKAPRTDEMWENHLSGKGDALGIIPINESNNCKWGCIDVDTYPLDHTELIQKIRRMKLPLVVCRSKSGGAHCFLFVDQWVAAKEMQEVLQHVAAALGYGASEIFPKQIKLFLERGDVGNFLNLSYYDAEDGLRYAIKDDGSSATLQEFFQLHQTHVQTPEQLLALTITDDPNVPIKDGPPCLQTLCAQMISEGGRNNGLFNVGVYLRKAYPDSWESEILVYNAKYFSPPLPLNEVNVVAKQLQKKEYAYMCKDAPINAYCNAEVCKTRKFGIEAAVSGATIANLRKYNSSPPVWFMDVNSQPLELDTEALMNQAAFQRACVEQLNFMPRSVSKPLWEGRINTLLLEMSDTDGSIVEVSQDASIQGQFYEYLDEFCTVMQKADNREEILLRRPFTDDDEGKTYFRLKDFDAFLRKNRFFEYKSHKIAQRLRDINGEATSLKINGKATRVWAIPAHSQHSGQVPTPLSSNGSAVPF